MVRTNAETAQREHELTENSRTSNTNHMMLTQRAQKCEMEANMPNAGYQNSTAQTPCYVKTNKSRDDATGAIYAIDSRDNLVRVSFLDEVRNNGVFGRDIFLLYFLVRSLWRIGLIPYLLL